MKHKLFPLCIAIILAFSLFGALPAQKALAATCTWTGSVDTSWTDSGNWSGCGGAPGIADDVTIPDVSPITNYPLISSAVSIVNVQINSGASLTVGAGGSLDMDGNLVCNGTYSATGRPSIFSGTTNQTVSGTGTTTFGLMTVNNTGAANNNIIEIMPTNFSADARFLTLIQGILKLSGSYTLSNSLFFDNNYIIAAGSGVWLNNPNVTVIAAVGTSANSRLFGSLRITAGTYNVGDTVGEAFAFETGSSLMIEGGALIVAGPFVGVNLAASSINFTMSGGTFTVGTVPGFSGTTFNIQGNLSVVTWSGGTVVIQNETSGTTDFRLIPGGAGSTITGGKVQFGNSLTTGSPSFGLPLTYIPSIEIVSNGSNTPSVVLSASPVAISGSITIGPNTTLNSNNFSIPIYGNSSTPGDWTNNGTFIQGTQSVSFNDLLALETIGGNNVTTFNNLTINNTVGSVRLARNTTVNGNLVVIAGAVFNASTYDITVAGTITNNGMIRQTKDVNGSSDVSFISTGSYGGVILNANSADLGTTTVSIWGNHDCTLVPNETVKRCFYIDPFNTTSRNATVTFFYADGELVAGSTCDTMNAWHNSGVWDTALTLDATYGGDGRVCESAPRSIRVTGVSTFSPFALRTGAPTVIQLSNLSAQSQVESSAVLLAIALGSIALGGCFMYLRKRNEQ